MDYGYAEYLRIAQMRQAEFIRQAEHDRLVKSLCAGQPGLWTRMGRAAQVRWHGRQRSAGLQVHHRPAGQF